MKIYANRLGMIPSTEIAHLLRVAAERKRLAAAELHRHEERASERAQRRREFWTRVRSGLTAARRAPAA